MAGIDVKNFVDVNITTKALPSVVGTRRTVVLYTGEGTASTEPKIVDASDFAVKYPATGVNAKPVTNAYLAMFFANGGGYCKVIEGVPYGSITQSMLADLANEEIVVAAATPNANVEAGYTAVKNLASGYQGTGAAQKIFLARTAVTTNNDAIANFAVKYSKTLGAEMTMAAYLSRIDVYSTDTVADYAFTIEAITPENLTNAEYTAIVGVNENADITLAGATRNIGGNCTDGADLTNTYVLIILQQTITERLLQILANKIRNSKGLSQIYSGLAGELENYRTCGYLSTDKSWEDDTWIVTRNGVAYTIIEQGTPLVSGYYIRVLPLSSLNDTERAQRLCPPVYVILADQYGIRKIEVTGEVI